MKTEMRSIFVSVSSALGSNGRHYGGVQICTNEYLVVLRQAGFDITIVDFEVDKRLIKRVARRIGNRPYPNVLPPEVKKRVVSAIRVLEAEVVFLNLVDLAPLAKIIRRECGTKVKVILLSHGLHSADLLHKIRLRSFKDAEARACLRDLAQLGSHLVVESEQRKHIDHVFCLSDFEVGLERWIGARSVSRVPRIVAAKPLSWHPVGGRLGFVGTLDHPPNAEGLHLFLEALSAAQRGDQRVRVVGGPVEVGREFARRYPTVDYLGPLDDLQLIAEAATWTCAIHPLFCYARGCSTKLATFLAWQIPVVTTPQGCRGYLWREGRIPQSNEPAGLVELACSMNKAEFAETVRKDLEKVVSNSPSLDDVAETVRADLRNIGLNTLAG